MPKTTKAPAKKSKLLSKRVASGLQSGDKAPDFNLRNDNDEAVKLSNYKGRKVVLYFYPKDDTPGCTAEACSFRDGFSEIQKRGVALFGVSIDTVESHKKFKEKFHLNFPLLSDADKKVVNAYGVWKEKNMYGKKYMGIERTTFIIDEDGKIKKVFPKVKVDGHYDEVIAEL